MHKQTTIKLFVDHSIRSLSENLFATFRRLQRGFQTRHRRRRRRHRPVCRGPDPSREGRARPTPFPVIRGADGPEWRATDRGKTEIDFLEPLVVIPSFLTFIKCPKSENSFKTRIGKNEELKQFQIYLVYINARIMFVTRGLEVRFEIFIEWLKLVPIENVRLPV